MNTAGTTVATDRGGLADQSWDPVWDVATTLSDSGWTAEIRIPFSQLRFSPADRQTWGLQMERRIARRQEQAMFAFTPKDQPAGVPLYGHLEGISGLRTRQRLEVLPYTVRSTPHASRARTCARRRLSRPVPVASRAFVRCRRRREIPADIRRHTRRDAQSGLRPGRAGPRGGELDGVRDCSSRRSGRSSSRVPRSCGSARASSALPRAVRRSSSTRAGSVARRSSLAPDSAVYADLPDVAHVLGAAKLTGRTARGWSVGMLEAVTGRERAAFVSAAGVPGRAEVEPLTSYFAGRLKRDLRGGRATLGGLVTAVNRRPESDAAAAQLRTSAYTAGADFRSETSDHVWSIVGSFSPSYVTGTASAIAATQRSSNHFFQRPDARHLRYDPNATSLAGYRAQLDGGKRTGNWTGNIAMTASSPGYEINDLGFQTSTDRIVLDPNVTYEHTRPGRILRRWSVRAGPDNVWNYDWDIVRRQSYVTVQTQFRSYWTTSLQVNHASPAYSDRLTRGGPLTRTPAGDGLKIDVASDPRRRYTLASTINRTVDRSGLDQALYSVDVGLKPADNWEIRIGPDLNRVRLPAQYVTAVSDPTATGTFGRRYVFAALNQTTLGIETRLNVTFTPRLTLEMYAQPFVATNDFGALKELRAPRTFDFTEYGAGAGAATRDSSRANRGRSRRCGSGAPLHGGRSGLHARLAARQRGAALGVEAGQHAVRRVAAGARRAARGNRGRAPRARRGPPRARRRASGPDARAADQRADVQDQLLVESVAGGP